VTLTDSLVAPATVAAYRETEYRVGGQGGLVLRVGQRSRDLLAAHSSAGVDCSAFVTACNPHSAPLSAAANLERQAALAEELRRLGFAYREGIGQHPDNGWPGEPSFLVLGISLEDARALGERYGQNAIVWSGADAVPQLVMLR
jgi:hypothetical protein